MLCESILVFMAPPAGPTGDQPLCARFRPSGSSAPAAYNIAMRKTPPSATPEAIEELLPQTQCRLCGFDGCRPYAEAVSAGCAGINRCPPGGEATIRGLARLTGLPYVALDPDCGVETPPAVAVIDEPSCIGCTLCIQACPVDAIVGAARQMHTVIAEECTGCRLCLPPCPVDCIVMVEAGESPAERARRASHFRQRHHARVARLERERAERLQAEQRKAAERKKRDTIERAMQRARQRLLERGRS
jgi:Na+-translocating ferredoxin:NAD+ oxidoreductase subunit B